MGNGRTKVAPLRRTGRIVVGVEYETNTVYDAWMDGVFYNVTNNSVIVPNGGGTVPEHSDGRRLSQR